MGETYGVEVSCGSSLERRDLRSDGESIDVENLHGTLVPFV